MCGVRRVEIRRKTPAPEQMEEKETEVAREHRRRPLSRQRSNKDLLQGKTRPHRPGIQGKHRAPRPNIARWKQLEAEETWQRSNQHLEASRLHFLRPRLKDLDSTPKSGPKCTPKTLQKETPRRKGTPPLDQSHDRRGFRLGPAHRPQDASDNSEQASSLLPRPETPDGPRARTATSAYGIPQQPDGNKKSMDDC